jgi:hypothetical protein
MPRSILLVLLSIWATLGVSGPVLAATHYVPDDFPSIQAAIDAADAEDTVIVRDGTWTGEANRELDFGGKDLILQSENGPGACTIDAEGAEGQYRRCFWFHGGETRASIVEGFTVTGGFATNQFTGGETGGGFLIENGSSPTIRNCIVENNRARHGAGIMVHQSDPYIENCIIRNNTGSVDGVGGGVYLQASGGALNNCEIRGNTANHAGGVITSYGTPTITGCLVINNQASTYGGGLWLSSAGTTIRFTTVSGNVATDGGGIRANANVDVNKCTVTGNVCTGPGHGGGISFSDSHGGTVTYSLVWGNVDDGAPGRGQIAIDTSGASNSASVDHSLVEGGEAYVFLGPNASVYWGEHNEDGDAQFCAADPHASEYWKLQSDSPAFTHVWGQIGAWASGCDATPTFLRDFTATPTAQGVDLVWDVGTVAAGEFRVIGRRNDERWQVDYTSTVPGAYVARDSSPQTRIPGEIVYELLHRPPGGSFSSVADRRVSIDGQGSSVRWIAASPNPFHPEVVLSFASDQPARISVTVWNLRGRQVARLADREFGAGVHEIPWNGRNDVGSKVASGTYLVRLEAEGRRVTSQKVTLLH